MSLLLLEWVEKTGRVSGVRGGLLKGYRSPREGWRLLVLVSILSGLDLEIDTGMSDGLRRPCGLCRQSCRSGGSLRRIWRGILWMCKGRSLFRGFGRVLGGRVRIHLLPLDGWIYGDGVVRFWYLNEMDLDRLGFRSIDGRWITIDQ